MSTFQEEIAPGPNAGLIEILGYRNYPSLASALREVVSNASDADANRFNITLSRTYDEEINREVWKLTFFDDGEGLTREEFQNYLRLSGRSRRKRTGSEATPGGRKIIGMLGIGSLAIAPWATRVEILTKKSDSRQVLHVKIPYGKFFGDSDIRDKELYGENGEYKYQIRTFEWENIETADVQKGFTIIDLVELTDEAKNELELSGSYSSSDVWQKSDLGLLGPEYSTYLASTKRGARTSFRMFPPLLRFMHQLALIIPVPYPASTPLSEPPIRTMIGEINAQCMEDITFQGIKLHRPMLILDQQTEEDKGRRMNDGSSIKPFQPIRNSNIPISQGKSIVINEVLPKSKVPIRGYIWGQNTAIKFEELNGVQVRIRNVGIGSYNFTLFDPVAEISAQNTMGTNRAKSARRAPRAQAISGEIFIDYSHELERALRGDREGFQEGNIVYRELKEAVYQHIREMYSKIDKFIPKEKSTTITPTNAIGSEVGMRSPVNSTIASTNASELAVSYTPTMFPIQNEHKRGSINGKEDEIRSLKPSAVVPTVKDLVADEKKERTDSSSLLKSVDPHENRTELIVSTTEPNNVKQAVEEGFVPKIDIIVEAQIPIVPTPIDFIPEVKHDSTASTEVTVTKDVEVPSSVVSTSTSHSPLQRSRKRYRFSLSSALPEGIEQLANLATVEIQNDEAIVEINEESFPANSAFEAREFACHVAAAITASDAVGNKFSPVEVALLMETIQGDIGNAI